MKSNYLAIGVAFVSFSLLNFVKNSLVCRSLAGSPVNLLYECIFNVFLFVFLVFYCEVAVTVCRFRFRTPEWMGNCFLWAGIAIVYCMVGAIGYCTLNTSISVTAPAFCLYFVLIGKYTIGANRGYKGRLANRGIFALFVYALCSVF